MNREVESTAEYKVTVGVAVGTAMQSGRLLQVQQVYISITLYYTILTVLIELYCDGV